MPKARRNKSVIFAIFSARRISETKWLSKSYSRLNLIIIWIRTKTIRS